MSKLHSSIQKAIELSRQTTGQPAQKSRSPHDEKPPADEAISTGIFRRLPFAFPNEEIMEESKIIAATDDRNAKSAYNVLRTRILQRMRSNNWHSILVTSPGAGEGKTVTAANLAMSIARDVNQSAILVDLDLMRSSVAKYLGIDIGEINAGVGDYLQGNAKIEDIVYSPGEIDRLAIVPNRGPLENSSDLIGSPRMRELATALVDQGGSRALVLYDMPPVLACDDVLAMCPNVDAILMVVGRGETERAALEKAVSMVSEYEVLGVVLNMTDEESGDNAYGYY